MDQRALASGGKILRRNGDGKGRYLVSGRDQRAQPSADGRERSGARRSELHGRPRFCAARRATAAGRSPGGGVDTFYGRNHGAIPDIAPHQWRLTVDKPVPLTYDQLIEGFTPHSVVT